MDLIQEQIDLETLQTKMGTERYYRSISGSYVGMEREFEGTVANRIIRKTLRDVLPAMRALRRECASNLVKSMTTGVRLKGIEQHIVAMSPEALAYITVKCALVASAHDYRAQRLATMVGIRCNEEINWEKIKREEAKLARARDYDPPNRLNWLRKKVKQINPKSIKKWLRKIDDIELDKWSKRDQFVLGTVLLDVLLKACPGFVTKVVIKSTYYGKVKAEVRVRPTKELVDALYAGHEHEALNTPWLMPMVCEPKPWVLNETGLVDAGGFLTLEQPFFKVVRFDHSSKYKGSASKAVVDAVNRIQATPWRINRNVLARALTAVEHNVGPLPYEAPVDMPKSIPAEEWAKMTTEERGAHKALRSKVHTHNNRAAAKKLSVDRVINVAKRFETREIYFPHNLDWRGRAYPLCQDLHPQSDDFAKSMLKFAEAKPLGDTGLQWLAFHMANCYGMDKLDREGQAEWVNDNADNILDVARDPFGDGLEFWQQADEPWQFLAAAIEYTYAWNWSTGPENYPSSLPVHVDGSCNGLQHLSAMALDPVAAKSVNLMPGPRQDVYHIVAGKVSYQIGQEAGAYDHGFTGFDRTKAAHNWQGHVTRKTVKRAVMTTPYGLTDIGMRDQLLQDRWCEGLEGDPMANANYLRDRILEAREGVLGKAMETMRWFQDCAEILAEQNKGITWTTPVGLRVTQRYAVKSSKVVKTLLGHLYFEENETDNENVAYRKQVLSIAPNIIHSFDAAHMMMSVNAAPEDFSFSVIHDSFGCHAADMETFLPIIREQFVDIYKTNWFAVFTKQFLAQGAERLTPCPERGDFDIEQVLDAEFFFA